MSNSSPPTPDNLPPLAPVPAHKGARKRSPFEPNEWLFLLAHVRAFKVAPNKENWHITFLKQFIAKFPLALPPGSSLTYDEFYLLRKKVSLCRVDIFVHH